MTTAPREFPLGDRVLTYHLQNLLTGLKTDSSLFAPEQLRRRLDALDELDIRLGGFDPGRFPYRTKARIHHHANIIRTRLEAINAVLYQSIRSEIVGGAAPHILFEWIDDSANRSPVPGLGYDYRDEVVSGILQLHEPSEPRLHPLPEMMFYQPSPVRHILQLIMASSLSEDDVFVDLGSGLGHVALLASMLTGVQTFGIEVEAAYVASARECAERLHLSRVRFIQQDAREADLSSGTVFYLYSPFTGSILADVLDRLHKKSTTRPIKICTLGPCTCALAKESWLAPLTLADPNQIALFQKRL